MPDRQQHCSDKCFEPNLLYEHKHMTKIEFKYLLSPRLDLNPESW